MSNPQLETSDFNELSNLNNQFKNKISEYESALNSYNTYVKNLPNPMNKTVVDYDYWPNYVFDITLPNKQSKKKGDKSQKTVTQSTCLTNCVNNINCLGASFIKSTDSKSINPDGYCYIHSSLDGKKNNLVSSDGNVAIVQKARYWLLKMEQINNELIEINNNRKSLYDKLSIKISNNEMLTQSKMNDFNVANSNFIKNKNKIQNELKNLGTLGEQHNFSNSLVEKHFLHFQMLAVILYAIIFISFKLLYITSDIANNLLFVGGLLTFVIIVTGLYQHMQ